VSPSPGGSRIVVGGSWLIAAQIFDRLFGIVSIAVLARILTPPDFGVVAVAGTVVAAVELLSAFGFDWALVRHQDLSADYLNTAWTLRVMLGGFSFAALALLGAPAAAFYRIEALRSVLFVLGVASLLGSLENIGTVYFRRDFAFHNEFLLRAVSKLCGFTVTVIIALKYRSYWALVLGTVTLRLTNTIASYLLQSYRPRFALAHARELLSFSSWLLIGNMIEYCREKFSDLYLGRVFGPRANGLFSVAGDLARVPISEIAMPINRVAYSKYAEDIRAGRGIAGSYLEIASLIWMVSLPMCAGIFAVADEVVAVLLGPKWSDAAPVMRLLAVGTSFTVLTANTHYVYWAVGHSRIVAAISAAGAAVIIPATFVCASLLGFRGVALAYALTSAVMVPVNFAFLWRLAGIRFVDLIARAWRVTMAAAVMLAILLTALPHPATQSLSTAAQLLAAKIVIGVAAYVGTSAALWVACGRPNGPESRALQLALKWIRRDSEQVPDARA
jgi:O-antigen/teichoic acid export membrane protein